MPAKSVPNQQRLAASLGVTQSAVSRYVKRPDWPVRRRGPWSSKEVKAIRQWKLTLREDPNRKPPPEKTHQAKGPGNASGGEPEDGPDYSNLAVAHKKTQIQLNHERMLHERLKRQISGGLFVPRDLLDTALGGLAGLFVQVCDELEMSLPSRFANKRADQIERELTKLLDSCRRRICEKAAYDLAHLSKIRGARKASKKRRGRPAVGSS